MEDDEEEDDMVNLLVVVVASVAISEIRLNIIMSSRDVF
jgi:hypothetical protein